MSKIKVMSPVLADKIAAGEVIERTSSVVKELVENSIDANAKVIKVELENAHGVIKVIDDGDGMDENDSKNCFLRHATSKIYKSDDLFFINTLGFRGEALASIASVSDVVLESCDGSSSSLVHIKGGEVLEYKPTDARKGTKITVSNLFYNTPARLKYLKSESFELAQTSNFIEKLALSHPEVAFTLINNNKVHIKTTGSNNLLKTIHEIYGALISENMIEIHASSDDYEINGYISKPIIERSTKNFLNTIINGRIIKNYELNKVINDAYHTYKPENVYPIVVIKIDTDPTLIDVNVHPSKQDIKFSKMSELKELLTSTIRESLKREVLIPKSSDTSLKYSEETLLSELPKTLFIEEDTTDDIKQSMDSNLYDKLSVQMDTEDLIKNNEEKKLQLYPVGIALGTYIIAENQEGVYLIDQHAAVERINYELVLKGLITTSTVKLLIPLCYEFSSSEMSVITSYMSLLEHMGFIIEEFGVNTLKVIGHPAWIRTNLEDATIRSIFDYIIESKSFDPLVFNDNLAATIACKKSLKGNTRITLDIARDILDNLVKCDNPYNCPHGRPTIIKFTIYELEKMFKRVM